MVPSLRSERDAICEPSFQPKRTRAAHASVTFLEPAACRRLCGLITQHMSFCVRLHRDATCDGNLPLVCGAAWAHGFYILASLTRTYYDTVVTGQCQWIIRASNVLVIPYLDAMKSLLTACRSAS